MNKFEKRLTRDDAYWDKDEDCISFMVIAKEHYVNDCLLMTDGIVTVSEVVKSFGLNPVIPDYLYGWRMKPDDPVCFSVKKLDDGSYIIKLDSGQIPESIITMNK